MIFRLTNIWAIYILVRKMEAEIVRMCVEMFNGGRDACGTVSYV